MDGACKRLSFGEGVWVRVRVIGIGLESGSESSVRVIEPSRSQGAHAQQIRHADQARRASGIERACILARVAVLQRRSGLCAAQIRQRIRFAAGKVYRHGYFVSRGASGEARTRRPQLWRHGARLFMHAALQGGQGFIATVYIDGSDESRPLNSNGRVPG